MRVYLDQLGGLAFIPPKTNPAFKPAIDEHLYT